MRHLASEFGCLDRVTYLHQQAYSIGATWLAEHPPGPSGLDGVWHACSQTGRAKRVPAWAFKNPSSHSLSRTRPHSLYTAYNTQSVDTLATTRQVALHYSPYSLPGLMGIGQWACIDWASNHIGYIGPADDVPLEGKASSRTVIK